MRRKPAIAVSLSVVAALSVACQRQPLPQPTRTATAAPEPTAPPITAPGLATSQSSAGDPYVPGNGNGGYDVQHYDLKLKVDPANEAETLDAVATIKARATTDLLQFNLDLTDLKVAQVKVNGQKAQHKRDGDELVISPAASLAGGADFTVAVEYSGTPKAVADPILGRYGWIKTPDGISAACQPSGAHTWFPSNDHPSDKATFTFHLTVPEKLTAVANGESSAPRTSGGFTTTTWQMKQPMATYLAMISVGDFKVRKGTTPKGIPIFVAVDSDAVSVDDFYTTKARITDEWVELFGPYPFGSTGGVVDNADVGFALEAQSRSIYGDFVPDGGIIAHELAHQWFGDSVGVTQWRDIWLNEGFASYAEWIWTDRNGGRSLQENFDLRYSQAEDAAWEVPTGDPGRDRLFDSFGVYERGAMTLHALRTKVGDDEFFEILRTWAAEYKYKNATTAQFVELSNRISGTNLNAFFQAWLYTPERPAL